MKTSPNFIWELNTRRMNVAKHLRYSVEIRNTYKIVKERNHLGDNGVEGRVRLEGAGYEFVD